MPLNFPGTPSNGQSYTENGVTYTYDSTYGVWKVSPIAVPDVFAVANAAFGVANTSAPSASPTFTGTVTFNANVGSQTLTDGASISWNAALGQVATVTLGGNRTLANATNLKVGTYILHIIQDGTGSRTLSFASQYKWPAGVAPTLTTTIGARDLISFVSDGTLMYGSFLPDVK